MRKWSSLKLNFHDTKILQQLRAMDVTNIGHTDFASVQLAHPKVRTNILYKKQLPIKHFGNYLILEGVCQ